MTESTPTSVTVAVLEAVAEAENADPLDLPPLYDTVDTDALESIFETMAHGQGRTGRVEFTYHGYHVTVDCAAEGTATVEIVHESPDQQPGRASAEVSLD